MVSSKTVLNQLKKIGFNAHGWGRTEVSELHNIILPDEEIYECVNGYYEGGFALLLASDVRVLLIDKKPLKFLTVEDLRFDMINEIDYNHTMTTAYINISAGNKDLHFRSWNQPRLRRLIGHVQRCMAEAKKKQSTHQEGQVQHLEQINQQLQAYLVAQYQQQQDLHDQVMQAQKSGTNLPAVPEPVKPSYDLANFLYAQGLLNRYEQETGQKLSLHSLVNPDDNRFAAQMADAGKAEVFSSPAPTTTSVNDDTKVHHRGFEINPAKIVFSKLPALLKVRRRDQEPADLSVGEILPAPSEPLLPT